MKKIFFLFFVVFAVMQVNAQQILSISPDNADRGTEVDLIVTCSGTQFLSSPLTLFAIASQTDSYLAKQVSVISDTKISVKLEIPLSAATGTYITVIKDSISGLMYGFPGSNGFTINNPAGKAYVASVTPNILTKGQRLDVTITGVNTHFSSGSQVVTFRDNMRSINATTNSVTVKSDTQLIANVTFPVNHAQTDLIYDLFLHTSNDGQLKKENAIVHKYTGEQASVVSISPAKATRGELVVVTLKAKGTMFTAVSSFDIRIMNAVNFGDINGQAINVINDSMLTVVFNIPVNARAGVCYLMVNTDVDGTLRTYDVAFTITTVNGKLPSLTAISPNKGKRGETLTLQITGANTSFAQASDIVFSLYNSATELKGGLVRALNDQTLSVNVTIDENAPLGDYHLDVHSVLDGSLVLNKAFSVTNEDGNIPAITNITPSSGKKGQTLDLTITGTSTSFTQGSQLYLNFYGSATGVTVNNIQALNDSTAKANISILPDAKYGKYQVYLSSLDGSLQYAPGFRVEPDASEPQLISVSKNRAAPGETLELTISGKNTGFTQATSTIYVGLYNDLFNYITGTDVRVINDTELKATFTIPDLQSYKGIYSLMVSDGPGNDLTLDDVFSIFSVGLKKNSNVPEIAIFPVPASDLLYLTSKSGIGNIQIMNQVGQTISVKPVDIESSNETTTISLSRYHLTPGVYYLRFEADGQAVHRKIFIQ